MSFKGYHSQIKKSGTPNEFATVEPVREYQHGLSVLAHIFMRAVTTDAAETGSSAGVVKATSHSALKGDVIRVTSGTHSGKESKVWAVSTDLIYIAEEIALANTDTFEILRHKYPLVGADGTIPVSASLAPSPIQFDLNGVDTEVSEITATPTNSRPLPVKVLDGFGAEVPFAQDGSVQDVLTELELHSQYLGSKTESAPGTDTASSGLNGRLQRIAQRLTSLIAATPAAITGFSTEAKQDAEAILVGAVTETAPASDTASSGLNGRLQRIAQRITSLIALVPASLGQKAKAASFAVTLASDEDLLTNVGGVTETAPASDTASSGLNGRLQRIAQRLTSLIALMPASLGQKAMSGSLAVTVASDQSSIPVSPANAVLTASGTVSAATNVFTRQDVSAYSQISVHMQISATATVTFEASNDDSDWRAVAMSSTSGAGAPTTVASSSAIFTIPVMFRYFRVRCSSYTNGTVQANLVGMSGGMSSEPSLRSISVSNIVSVAQSGNFSVRNQDGSGNAITSEVVGANRALHVVDTGPAIVDFLDTLEVLDASSTNIKSSGTAFGSITAVVSALAAACSGIRVNDTTGEFIGVYSGASPTLRCVIGPGVDGIIPCRIPSGEAVKLRNMANADITTGKLCIQFLG